MTTELNYFKVNRPDVVSETIDGESVIINLSTGSYYSLNKAGADIWNLIEAQVSLPRIVGWLIERYDINSADIEQAVAHLIVQLQQEELVTPISAEAFESNHKQSEEILLEKLPFEAPVLQKYTDMQDLLLLDPIHEVDQETGWPNEKVA